MLKAIGKRNSLAAILSTQGNFRFYIVAMPSEVLGLTCFTIGREEDPIEGFQRRLDEARAEDIALYIDNGLGSIPTAIVLSAQDEADLKYSSNKKTVSFIPAARSFLIIDGQHRVWGFSKAKTSIRVPVVIFEGLTRSDEAQLFIDINSNQKEVPEELLLDVKQLLKSESETEKQYSALFEMFYTDDASCLREYLVRAEKVKGKLSRITFNKSISLVLNNFPDTELQKIFTILNNYLCAFINVLEEIEPGLGKTITKPVFFQGVLAASPFVMDKTLSVHSKLSYNAFYEILTALKDNMKLSQLKKPGTSYIRFSDNIKAALTKLRINNSIITED